MTASARSVSQDCAACECRMRADGAPLENNRTKKRDKKTGLLEDDTDRVEKPYLVKLCASTWDAFVMRASIDNVLDGFLARFLIVTGSAIPRRMERATQELEHRR